MAMADDAVVLSCEGGVATLTFNRPETLNAASAELMAALERALRATAALPGLRAVILTGSGRAFCAGGDLKEFEAALNAGGSVLIDTLRYNQDVIQMVEDLPVPVIAAVNGVAVAGVLEMLLACDISVAADDARIGDGHAKYGVVPAGGATVRLAERIGPGRAAQLFYTAALVDAARAEAWGLVNEVVAGARLMERANEIARQISLASPEAVRHLKQLTGRMARSEHRAGRIRAELDRFRAHLSGADLGRGLASFRAKRKPQFD